MAHADLPAGCTPSGATATCTYTYYANSPVSQVSACSGQDTLGTTEPTSAGSGGGFCTVYEGPDIQVTSVSFTGYVGYDAAGPYDGVDMLAYAGATQFASYYLGSSIEEPSCPTVTLSGTGSGALHSSPYDLDTGTTLALYSADGTAQFCTGPDTPTSITITGTLLGTVTTSTETSTATATTGVIATYTATTTATVTSAATSTSGTCAPSESLSLQYAALPTYTVTSTTTTTSTTTVTSIVTLTTTVTQTDYTCSSSTAVSPPNAVPQFPSGLAILFVLSIPALLILRKSAASLTRN